MNVQCTCILIQYIFFPKCSWPARLAAAFSVKFNGELYWLCSGPVSQLLGLSHAPTKMRMSYGRASAPPQQDSKGLTVLTPPTTFQLTQSAGVLFLCGRWGQVLWWGDWLPRTACMYQVAQARSAGIPNIQREQVSRGWGYIDQGETEDGKMPGGFLPSFLHPKRVPRCSRST